MNSMIFLLIVSLCLARIVIETTLTWRRQESIFELQSIFYDLVSTLNSSLYIVAKLNLII